MSQLNPCANCGNYDFEDEDGVLVCTQCGRQQEGGLQVADDSGDFGTQGKISRKKVKKTKVKVTKIYRGAKGYRLYLQAWQHILWKQAHALIHGSVKAPPELWTVARDLWTLRLSHFSPNLDSNHTTIPVTENSTAFTSADETNLDSEVEVGQSNITKRPTFSPSLWDTISHLYLSTLLLRIPLPLSKVYHLIRAEELPFIRAIRHIPYEMTSRLPSEYQRALDTTTVPTPVELQQAVNHLVYSYAQDFGISIPALNWRILLFEWLQTLALPIEVYPAVKQLVTLTNFDFIYDCGTEKRVHERNGRNKPRKTPVVWPEMQLISLIIVATKLLFPFPIPITATTTHPRSPTEPSTSTIRLDWSIWLSLHKQQVNSQNRNEPIKPGKEIEIHDTDLLEMSDDALDAYMDWYQRTFATPDSVLATKKTNLEKSILDMFPVPSIPRIPHKAVKDLNQADDLTRKVQREAILPPAQNTSGAGDNETRNAYLVFPSLESLEATNSFFSGEVEKNPVLYFYEKAADVACVDLERLVRAVRYTERKLEKWVEAKRRDEVFGEGQEEEAEEEAEEEGGLEGNGDDMGMAIE